KTRPPPTPPMGRKTKPPCPKPLPPPLNPLPPPLLPPPPLKLCPPPARASIGPRSPAIGVSPRAERQARPPAGVRRRSRTGCRNGRLAPALRHTASSG